jgi:phenylacetate-CoA ligase
MDAKAIRTLRTSGSTGRPVEVDRYTAVEAPLYAAGALLDERWHGRDPSLDVALIKDVPDAVRRGWGGPRPEVPNPGRSHSRNLVNHTPAQLWAWLAQVRPAYLSTTPAMALRLAELALRPGEPGLSIAQIVTFGEPVTDELRRAAREAFGAKVVDRYSCEELGWIAFQCPKHDHLHVLSSNVVVEVVDDDGQPCAPGRTGRVLLTALNSWAMPLVRYDIGDRAEPGDTCDCGLTLPVLRRVLGRERSFILMPDGSMRLARLTGEYWRRVAPVSEYRVVQYADGLIEGFVTAERALSADEIGRLRTMLSETLGYPGEVLVTQVESIPWESRWKRIDVARVDRLHGEPIAGADG